MTDVVIGLLIPLLGTSLGALCVFSMRGKICVSAEGIFSGLAAGVMTAASVWSLLLPAIERSEKVMGKMGFLPPSAGFAAGVLGLMFLENHLPQFGIEDENTNSGTFASLPRGKSMMLLAVTLHNIPEGMAVGAVYAGVLYGIDGVTASAAMALAVGIAIQNFPEGAIISMPLKSSGMSRAKAFVMGVLSGVVEPVGGFITIIAAGAVIPALPFMLSFAAGAMIYVVVGELIPESAAGCRSGSGIISFAAGFLAMMILDVVFG